MEKLNKKIDEMFTELMDNTGENIEDMNFKSLNDIKNNFRQHINNRRDEDQTELIMDEQLIERLRDVKVLSYDILQKFRKLNTSINSRQQSDESQKFADLDEFNRYVSNQQEILNSELWKIDVLQGYLLEK